MKKINGLLLFVGIVALVAFAADNIKAEMTPALIVLVGGGALLTLLAMSRNRGQLNTGLDVSALATTLTKFAGAIIMKRVNDWQPGEDFQIAKNVKVPMALPKISTAGISIIV